MATRNVSRFIQKLIALDGRLRYDARSEDPDEGVVIVALVVVMMVLLALAALVKTAAVMT